jgi:hypothetical protein
MSPFIRTRQHSVTLNGMKLSYFKTLFNIILPSMHTSSKLSLSFGICTMKQVQNIINPT